MSKLSDQALLSARDQVRSRFDSDSLPEKDLLSNALRCFCAGYRLSGNGDTLKVIDPRGGIGHFTRCMADNAKIGLSLG